MDSHQTSIRSFLDKIVKLTMGWLEIERWFFERSTNLSPRISDLSLQNPVRLLTIFTKKIHNAWLFSNRPHLTCWGGGRVYHLLTKVYTISTTAPLYLHLTEINVTLSYHKFQIKEKKKDVDIFFPSSLSVVQRYHVVW